MSNGHSPTKSTQASTLAFYFALIWSFVRSCKGVATWQCRSIGESSSGELSLPPPSFAYAQEEEKTAVSCFNWRWVGCLHSSQKAVPSLSSVWAGLMRNLLTNSDKVNEAVSRWLCYQAVCLQTWGLAVCSWYPPSFFNMHRKLN